MTNSGSDKAFVGAVPKVYAAYMVPMFFEPYAGDLVERLQSRNPARVLEVAAGTGVVTRAMAALLPESVSIVATDLNQPMLDQAAALGTTRPVEWRQADALQLPLPDGTFDAVVCQFGVMFFPDKARAFSEARRVLRPGGAFLFSTWDKLAENEFAHAVTEGLAARFPEDPPRFLERIPHGYHERVRIERDLADAAFAAAPRIVTVVARSRARSPRDPAIALCQGTPLRDEIEARGASPEEATAVAEEAIARRFGRGEVEGKMQANVVTVER
jgi:ubiquinone/menaquinone biosynthesis C-methylase UbiE